MIELRGASYSYGGRRALDRVTLAIRPGELAAVIGPNASGKTTLAMAMSALLAPEDGDCMVGGVSTRDDPVHARRAVGLVFQNPENQVVARIVGDDVAFGPANLGLGPAEIGERVAESLAFVGLGGRAGEHVSSLSGGQKQLLAIAGILAMRPSFVVLDEPTALLDGPGRRMVHAAAGALAKKGIGVVYITHDMEEALSAGRVIALLEGKVVADMPPHRLFSDGALLERIGVEPPYTHMLSMAVRGEAP